MCVSACVSLCERQLLCVCVWQWEWGSPQCGCRLMGAIISMPKTLSDEESLPGDRPRPINLQRSGHLPGSEPTYGWCLCCCCGGGGGGIGKSPRHCGDIGKQRVPLCLVLMVWQLAWIGFTHHFSLAKQTAMYVFISSGK